MLNAVAVAEVDTSVQAETIKNAGNAKGPAGSHVGNVTEPGTYTSDQELIFFCRARTPLRGFHVVIIMQRIELPRGDFFLHLEIRFLHSPHPGGSYGQSNAHRPT